jgi:AcrR family transcriptional regulator
MTSTFSPAEEKKSRMLAVARELIHETGDFDLPMRKLAARAQVSLRTPYEYFGSKAGLIGAILQQEIEIFKELVADRRSTDELEHLLDRVQWGIDFYSKNQPFYRSLFRATQAYSPGHDEEPARESFRSFQVLCNRAYRAGLIRPEVDPLQLGDTLTDIWASNLRTWARDEYDIQLASRKISFGFACVLAGVAREPAAGRMREHIVRFREQIDIYGGVTPLGPPRRAIPRPVE